MELTGKIYKATLNITPRKPKEVPEKRLIIKKRLRRQEQPV
jgi:hypothetical protein